MIAAVLLSGSGGIKDLRHCFSAAGSSADSDDDYHIVDVSQDQTESVDSTCRDREKRVDWTYLAACPATVCADGEAARGGAVLSAAEMESCKHYLEGEDGESTLAYAVGCSAHSSPPLKQTRIPTLLSHPPE